MTRHHGKSGALWMSTSGTGTKTVVASLSKWSLDMKRDKVEVTAFGDSNKQYVAGLKDISGSFSGFFDSTSEAIWTAADSSDGVTMILYPDTVNTPTKCWSGPAWVDASIDTDVGSSVNVAGTFSANGTWTKV